MQTAVDTLKYNASAAAQTVAGVFPSGILAPREPEGLMNWEDVEKPAPDEDVKMCVPPLALGSIK